MHLKLPDLAKRDGPRDGRTYGRTDKPAYRDAWTHLKRRVGGERDCNGVPYSLASELWIEAEKNE